MIPGSRSNEVTAESVEIATCDQNVDKDSLCAKAPFKQFTCYECEKSFPSNSDVIMHLKLVHNACASRDCSKISDFKMHSSVCANRGFGCLICDANFSEKYLLLMHFNEHIGAAFYVCDICRDGFQQRKDLQKHLLRIHSKNVCVPVIPSHSKAVYQKCPRCSKYYRLFAEFEEHSTSCRNPAVYACSVCQICFSDVLTLDEHKSTEHKHEFASKGYLAFKHGKRYFCGSCFMGFFKGSVLIQHLETHKRDLSYICDVCNSRFTSDEDLQGHYLLHIEEHYVLHDVISQHSCGSCKKTFKTQHELKIHMLDCSENLSESLKMEPPSNQKNISQPNGTESAQHNFDPSQILIYVLKTGENLLNCDDKQCVVVMDLQSVFVLQRGICASESRMPDVSNSQMYHENDAIDASLLQTYMSEIFNPVTVDRLPDDTCAVSEIEMEDFPQNFSIDSGTVEEVTVHSMESNESSTQDNKMFCETLLFVEDSCSETVGERYEVVTCDTLSEAEWSSDSNRNLSNVVVQVNEVPFINKNPTDNQASCISRSIFLDKLNDVGSAHTCNICNQIFSSKTSLCFHMKKSHTGFDCYRCGKSFKSEEELKNHEKDSHTSAFNCDLCEMSYSKEHLLKKHKRCAHGGKHFLCDICGKSYVLKNEYEVHLMLHKGETPPSKCEICGKVYASVSNYIRHKAIHEGKSLPQKYKCSVCDKGFVARNPLKRHLATHIKRSNLSYECPECKMCFPPKQLTEHIKSHNPSS